MKQLELEQITVKELAAESEPMAHEVLELLLLHLPKSTKVEQMVRDILIVEDNENNAKIVKMLVKQLGYPAHVVGSAQEALNYCKENTPRLVLMDLGLPDIDGIDLTHRMKKISRFEDIPIVAVSAHADGRVKDLAMEAGCIQFITKPFMPSDFMEQIKQVLSSEEDEEKDS